MSRVRTRLEQYKAEIEKKSQYKHGLPGSALDIVNTLLNDLEQDEKENGWIPKRGKINRDNLTEEIADVLICIEMLKQMYMISDEKINKWIEKKQAREAERMKKNE